MVSQSKQYYYQNNKLESNKSSPIFVIHISRYELKSKRKKSSPKFVIHLCGCEPGRCICDSVTWN